MRSVTIKLYRCIGGAIDGQWTAAPLPDGYVPDCLEPQYSLGEFARSEDLDHDDAYTHLLAHYGKLPEHPAEVTKLAAEALQRRVTSR